MSHMLVGLNNLKLLRYSSYCGDKQNVYNIPIPKIAFYSIAVFIQHSNDLF